MPGRPWWKWNLATLVVAVIAVVLVCYVTPILFHLAWLLVLLAVTAWVVGPDVAAISEKSKPWVGHARRAMKNPRIVRAMAYVGLALAWWWMLF
ncbi:hypothetical protein Pla175_12450 [Pirellulimonas nuda]|uniref:Uncharacterized protein n=1 Tax=Pirellulimonas nuda TaxID=2528009 RepID=A0A518D8T2_9BACT|nr:hypothetical protein [Pirellulimonas nuda]QDU87878.1 hypothetical protein Pla175_12450 [Pirellulimonas nuda]